MSDSSSCGGVSSHGSRSYRSMSQRSSSPRDRDERQMMVATFNSGSSRRSRRHSTDSLYSEPPSAHVPPPNSRLCLFFFIALIAASLPLIYLVTTSQLPTQTDVQQRLTHWIRGDEITIHRDLSTKQWGIRYTETLMLTQVHEGSQAKRDGAARFLSRKITHANGVSVSDAESFKVVASRVDDTLTLRFAPSQFVAGASVRATSRVLFSSGDYIETGARGVIVRVPGEREGSLASIKSPGIGVWDAFPGQIEPDEMGFLFLPGGMVRTQSIIAFESGRKVAAGSVGVVNKVPGDYKGSVAEVHIAGLTWDAMPGQVEPIVQGSGGAGDGAGGDGRRTPAPPTIAQEEVVQMLATLGHQQYLPRLLAFGLDRLDFIAVCTKREGAVLGIKALHWKRIVNEAQRRIPLSGRGRSGLEQLFHDLGEQASLRRVINYGIDRLDQLAKAEPRDGASLKFKAPQWTHIIDEAKKRLNLTVSHEEVPMTDAQRGVFIMLQNVGMGRHFKRLLVFGLDSVDRMAKSQNISSTIDLTGWEWDRIRQEAINMMSGKAGNVLKQSVDPEGEKAGDLQEHDRLAKEFDDEDTQTVDAGGAEGGEGAGHRSSRPRGDAVSVLDDVVHSAESKKEDARRKISNLLQKLTNDDDNAA